MHTEARGFQWGQSIYLNVYRLQKHKQSYKYTHTQSVFIFPGPQSLSAEVPDQHTLNPRWLDVLMQALNHFLFMLVFSGGKPRVLQFIVLHMESILPIVRVIQCTAIAVTLFFHALSINRRLRWVSQWLTSADRVQRRVHTETNCSLTCGKHLQKHTLAQHLCTPIRNA